MDAERGTLEHIFTVNIGNEIYLLYGFDKSAMWCRNIIMTAWLIIEFDLYIWSEISRAGWYWYILYLGQVSKYEGDAVEI